MIVEDALVSLGDEPVKNSPFSHVIVAMANGYFMRNNIAKVTKETPASHIYAQAFSLPTNERTEFLSQKVGKVRDRNTYRLTLLVMALIAALIVVPVMIIEIISVGTGNGGQGFQFLLQLTTLFIENLEKITP